MQHLLRAISGPQAGAVYVLGRRTTLGRASDCDIQVLHEGVSRQHAKVSQNADGQMVVTDLSSDNGTYVENQRITRQVLEPGDAIRIMSSRFVYEVLERGDQVTSAVFHRKVTSGDSLRQTANHRASMASARAMSRSKGGPAERGRPASRPQAAAPAHPGARPGGLVNQPMVRSDGIETRAVTREVPLAEQEPVYDARQATREEETDSGEYVRRRWPGVPNQEQVPDHSLARQPTVDERADDWTEESPSARTIGYGEAKWRPFARGSQRERDNGYGWQAG